MLAGGNRGCIFVAIVFRYHLNVIENFFNSVANGECFLLGSVSQFLVNCVCMPFEYSNKYVVFLNLN